MLKRRILAIMVGLALMVATTGLFGITADALGYIMTDQAHACGTNSSAGGGC